MDNATPLTGTVSDDPIAVLTARLDRLEKEVKETRDIAEDADRTADGAQDTADEVDGRLDGLEREVEDLDGGDYDDEIRELQDEIRYLRQRMDRLELAARSRSRSA